MLQVGRRRDQPANLFPAEYDGQRTRKINRTHLRHQCLFSERRAEEELQPGDRRVQGNGRYAAVHQIQLVAPQVLDGGSVGRAPEEDSELSYHT